jgi:hypothetical protein
MMLAGYNNAIFVLNTLSGDGYLFQLDGALVSPITQKEA